MNLDRKARMLRCCVLACLAAGCSSGLEGVDKRLSAMQDEITKVQNQNDRLVERIDAMESRQNKADSAAKAAAKSEPKATGSAGGASERPNLKVVRVVPEDTSGMPSPQVGTQAPGDAADDPSPRPLIKLRGGSGKGDKSEGKGES